MKKIIIAVCLILPLLIIGILFLTYWSSHNKLTKLDVACDTQLSEIDNMLKRRADLVPNLVNTVKGYAKHEKEIFVAVAEARAKIGSAKSVKEKSLASSMMDKALGRLLVVVEKYPDLKSIPQFAKLNDEIAGTENRISTARTDFNDAVAKYNKTVRRFPNNILAGFFGFEKRSGFSASEGMENAPNLDAIYE